MTTDLTTDELTALRAYAQGRRADLKATRLGEVRCSLAAAGLVRNCSNDENPMMVTPTNAGREVLAVLDRPEPMTEAAADWVYDVVLTRRYKESVGAIMWTGAGKGRRDEGRGIAMVRTCQCGYGLCGRCSDGTPEKCSHLTWRPGAGPETHIVNQRGYAVAEAWLSGKPCLWMCPTAATPPTLAPEPVPKPGNVQLELFALAGGAR